MNTATEPQRSATDWLRQALIAGAVESAHIKVLAEQAGIGPKALRNARERLGVVATRHGHSLTMRSVWTLPVDTRPEPGSDGIEGFRADEMLSIAKVKTAGANAGLTEAEAANLERRVHQFVERGMNAAHGCELAIRLVVERDRAGSKAGSCIECQSLRDSSCEPGAQGHTPGPRDPSEIWMCWTARRAW